MPLAAFLFSRQITARPKELPQIIQSRDFATKISAINILPPHPTHNSHIAKIHPKTTGRGYPLPKP
jgi:hypothetical protein